MVKKVNSDLEGVAKFYNDRFLVEGDTIKSVGWSSKDSQLLRFKILLETFELQGKCILDVGCGLGDLVPYLEELTAGDFKYIGLDISEELIKKAQQKYPQKNCEFIVGDILSTDLQGLQVDYAIESGAFSFKITDNESYVRAAMQKMYEVSREGIALNFLTSYADYSLEKNFHFEPEKIFSWAQKLSRFVSISHDYKLWEFTVRILRSPFER